MRLCLCACVSAGAFACSTPPADEAVRVTSVGDEATVATRHATPQTRRVELPALEGPFNPQLDMIYQVVRFEQWIVTGTQGGVVVWDPERRVPVATHEEFICNSVVVALDSVWAGCDKHVLRWNAGGWEEHLANDENDADYYQLVIGPQGEVRVGYGSMGWQWDVGGSGFVRSSQPFAGSYHAIYHHGELWAVDFMSGLRGPQGTIPIQSAIYPGDDPRRLHIDETERLWVQDFGSGLYVWQNGTFVSDPEMSDKATGVAIDIRRDRQWMLHYTDGLIVREGERRQSIGLSDLSNMRDMLLDPDGSIWVGSWRGLARVALDGTSVERTELRLMP